MFVRWSGGLQKRRFPFEGRILIWMSLLLRTMAANAPAACTDNRQWRTLIAVLVARLKDAVAHGGQRLWLLLPREAAVVSRTTTAWYADELDTLNQITCEAVQRLSRYGWDDDCFGGCCRDRLCSRHGRRRLLLLYLSMSSGLISIDRFWRAI
jgi:hypothetical protein